MKNVISSAARRVAARIGGRRNGASVRRVGRQSLLEGLEGRTLMAVAPTFNFTLTGTQKTSAGVFTADGTLVRTLWSGVTYNSGTHTKAWDGLDDFGNKVADGNYQVKVLGNNVTYTWEGVIGNTSASPTTNIFRGYDSIAGLTTVGNTVYYGNGYSEGGRSAGRFDGTSPNNSRTLIGIKGGDTFLSVTDGTTVYWSGQDAFKDDRTNYVWASTVGPTDAIKMFANGQAYTPERLSTPLPSVINKRSYTSDSLTNRIDGMAVQKTGNLLFVARTSINTVDVLDKNTGALIASIPSFVDGAGATLTAPASMVTDGSGNLWVELKDGTTSEIHQYSVNSTTGALTHIKQSAVSFSAPLGMALTPDGTTIAVVDGGTSQQVKAFTVSSGASAWTLGQAGGYATNGVTVANDKFLFKVKDRTGITDYAGIAFQSDGSFWVTDIGNDRVQHFSASRTYIDQIQYLSASYFMAIDQNNTKRLFSDFQEYEIDYTKPLSPTNGSWTLKRNWQEAIPTNYGQNKYRRLYPQTLSNGKTYALLYADNGSHMRLFEMTAAGTFRDTGITTTDVQASFQPDGSIRSVNRPGIDGTITWMIRRLNTTTPFDAAGNPVYQAASTLATTAAEDTDPAWWSDPAYLRAGVQTSGDLLISFDSKNVTSGHGHGYHLGAVKIGENKWKWRTSMATHEGYYGDYPTDGSFDVGNDVHYAGNAAMTLGSNVFWGYHGEFYKASQTNMYAHYDESGLFVNNFGTVGAALTDDTETYAPAGFAGNSFSPWVVQGTDGKAYLYHNDESRHAAVHRWRIDGLTSIQSQTANITLNAAAGQTSGLRGTYFDTADLSNPGRVSTRTDANINPTWGTAIPAGTGITSADTYSVRWEGFLDPGTSGRYSLYANAEAGGDAKVWINGMLITDRSVINGGQSSGGQGAGTVSSANGVTPDKAFDGSNSTKWLLPRSTGWLRYNMGDSAKRVISRYSITSANDLPDADPKTWNLEASNDGTTWTVINSQANQVFAARGETKTYTIRGVTGATAFDAYKFYRLNITANAGNTTTTQVAEMKLEERAIDLTAGVPAKLVMEYSHNTGAATPSLTWGRDGLLEEPVPAGRFSWVDWHHPAPSTNPINLLENLKFDSPLETNRYGWNRTGSQSTVSGNRWLVQTNHYTSRGQDPDLWFFYRKNTNGSTESVTRDLGTPSDTTGQWSLSGQIMYPLKYPNENDLTGQWLEVLDDSGKVITRLNPQKQTRANPTTGVNEAWYQLRGNGQPIYDLTYAQEEPIRTVFQPFSVSALNGTIKFTYGTYQLTTSTLVDPTANWRRPATLRMRFATNNGSTDRAVAVKTLTFERNSVPVAPTGLTAAAVSQSQINLAWTDASNNETSYVVDRATNSTFTTGLVSVTMGANATGYNSTGLTANTTYYYRVRAVNAAGASANSATASAITTAAPLLQANFDGSGTGTGGPNDLVKVGGTGQIVASSPALGNSMTIQNSPPIDGNFVRSIVTSTGGSSAGRVLITPSSAATSWAALTTKPGSQWLFNGGYDFFMRANGTPTNVVNNRALDFTNVTAGGWRMIFLATGTGMGVHLLPPTGAPTTSQWSLTKPTTFAKDQLYHVGVTFNTNPTTGEVTVRYFKKAGTGAIDTTSATDLLHQGTFNPDEAFVTAPMLSGQFAFNQINTVGGDMSNDADTFRLWGSDPLLFPSASGGTSMLASVAPTTTTTTTTKSPTKGNKPSAVSSARKAIFSDTLFSTVGRDVLIEDDGSLMATADMRPTGALA